MHDKERDRKQELLDAYKDRLHQRQLQLAKYGLSTDPSIIIEIKEIEGIIVRLEDELSITPHEQKTLSQYITNNVKKTQKQVSISYFVPLSLLLGLVFFGIYLFFVFQPYAIGATWKRSGYELTLVRVLSIGSRIQVEWQLTNNTGQTIELPATFYNGGSFRDNLNRNLVVVGLVCPDGKAGIGACDNRRYVLTDGNSSNFIQYVQLPVIRDDMTDIVATFTAFADLAPQWKIPISD